MADIGILGGTFDPIHKAHLALGRQAYEQFHLDAVWFMPSNHPPHKKDHPVTAGEIRREMVSLAVRGIPGFVCSDFELRREGNTYTAKTLSLLSKEFPGDRFYFIIGADSLYEIENWYHPETVMALAVLLVAEIGKGVFPLIHLENNISAPSSVSPVGTAAGDIKLPAEGHVAVPSFAGFDKNFCVIGKHTLASLVMAAADVRPGVPGLAGAQQASGCWW